MNKASAYSISSIFIPFTAYLIYFLTRSGAAAQSGVRTYLPLLAFNVVGIVLSVTALSLSNPRPTDTSFKMRIAVFLAVIGIFANTIVIEMVLAFVYPLTPLPE